MKFSTIFPDIWSIHERQQQEQQKLVKLLRQTFRLDGRMTKWIPYHFNKIWPKLHKGWFYYFKQL